MGMCEQCVDEMPTRMRPLMDGGGHTCDALLFYMKTYSTDGARICIPFQVPHLHEIRKNPPSCRLNILMGAMGNVHACTLNSRCFFGSIKNY